MPRKTKAQYRKLRKVTELDIKLMIYLYLRGASPGVIAKKIGVTRQNVRYHLKKNNIKLRKRDDYYQGG